jgi:hypothetical protein
MCAQHGVGRWNRRPLRWQPQNHHHSPPHHHNKSRPRRQRARQQTRKPAWGKKRSARAHVSTACAGGRGTTLTRRAAGQTSPPHTPPGPMTTATVATLTTTNRSARTNTGPGRRRKIKILNPIPIRSTRPTHHHLCPVIPTTIPKCRTLRYLTSSRTSIHLTLNFIRLISHHHHRHRHLYQCPRSKRSHFRMQ